MRLLLKRWWWFLLVALTVVGLARVRFDVEILNLLPDGLPVVQGLRLYQKHFTGMRELVVTVRAPAAEQAESAARQIAESLRQETNLVAEVVWQPACLEHPEQMGELIAYLWLNQPPELFAQLAQRLAPERLPSLLRETREQLATSLSPVEIGRLSYDPFGFTRLPETGLGDGAVFSASEAGFASADGAFRVVYAEARTALTGYRKCAAWLADIQAVVGRCQSSPSWPGRVTVRYTGAPPFTTEIATGMERDMQGSVLATLVLIVLLFWWAHRSWRPLVLLLLTLGCVVTGALAAGGLIFSKLNAVSLGFAAILMGLTVDYGLVIYHEWLAAPRLAAPALRRLIAPSILWSAVTTATAFGLLNFAGLPGLSQLGSLVGIGILLAAGLMLFAFLPLVLRWGQSPSRAPSPPATTLSRVPPIPQELPTISPLPFRRGEGRGEGSVVSPGFASPMLPRNAEETPRKGRPHLLCLIITAASACLALGILWRAWPRVEHSSSPLQPKHSAPQMALNELQAELNRQGDPLLLVVSGRDEAEVAQRLEAAHSHLARATTNHALRSFLLPTALWPHPDRQRSNLVTARALAGQAEPMASAAAQAGFTPDAFALTRTLLHQWDLVAGTTNVLWPTNQASRWLLQRATAWTGGQWLAVGALYPATNALSVSDLATLDPALPGVWLTGWSLLGESLLQGVENRLWGVMAAMLAMMATCLWLAFRGWREVLLSFAALAFSVLMLLAVMGAAGWSWNLMNLMALPLLLGAGVDYTIHVQLALRRHGGDAAAMRRVTGRAVFLCAATTVAGFGSNAFGSNAGLSSLGLVCASGIAIAYLTAVFLLPAWWTRLCLNAVPQPPAPAALGRHEPQAKPSPSPSLEERAGERRPLTVFDDAGVQAAGLSETSVACAQNNNLLSLPLSAKGGEGTGDAAAGHRNLSKAQPASPVPRPSTSGGPVAAPSSFYRAGLWRLGLAIVRTLPAWLVNGFCIAVAELHFRLRPERREVVMRNLLPVCAGDRAAAERTARQLYRRFAMKLADLWRVESGLSVRNWVTTPSELEIIQAAVSRGRGVLFITLHLGNWEHGGLLLAELGIKLTVLTLAEPDASLTQMRSASRARWGIDTLIIGQDQFAFIEVIKRLQAGAALAISIDRPPERSSVPVEFFGQPFRASNAAAELARASGCALIGVTIVRRPEGFAVKVLPEFGYDRRALGTHEARRQLTQQMLRAFEPEIRKHLDQWYQFVPIWPAEPPGRS